MKLSIIFIFFTIIQATASGFSQNVSINAENQTIKEVLQMIESQSSYRFFYNDQLSGLNNTVTLKAENKSLNELLSQVLTGQQFAYTILDNNMVVIAPKEFIQQKRISGTVKDATGELLPGVNVVVDGTTIGTTTDINGKYSIEVANDDAVLVFSFIGFTTQKIVTGGQSVIDVTLAPDVKSLEEVVVIGYGTQKKVDLTGSVSYVKGDDLTKVNAGNLSNAVAGRLPGLQVTQSSGAPGAASIFKIRGVGSILSTNDPLILIDGFEGNINQISPEDVESISILKDAASAAIYGTRAANGVVLVTTKRGVKNQPLRLEVTSQAGYQWATNIPEILGSAEWARKHNQAVLGKGGTPYWVGDQAPENQTTNTNWLNYIFQRAPMQDVHASAIGGTESLQYSINLGYFNQDGILIGENYKKANLRANIDYIGKNYSLGANITQFKSWNTSTITRGNAMPDAFLTPPTVPIVNPDGFPGTPRRNVAGENVFNDYTPYMDANARDNYRTENSTVANIYFDLKLLKGLRFKTIFNVNTGNIFNQVFLKQWFSYYPDDVAHTTPFRSNPIANLRDESNTSYRWESQNLLTYTADFNNHHVDALLGISAQKDKGFYFWGSNSTYPRNDALALDAGSTNILVGGAPGESSIASQFGRINYSYNDRYLLQVNVRRDGSSSFAPGHRWGVFPSVSAGWRISQEEFMKDLTFISNLKLKAGYGTLGNSAITPYVWLSNVSLSGTDYIFGSTPTRQPGSAIKIGYNDKITWESTTTKNIGFDLGLLNNSINITAEIFDRNTTDVLLRPPLPATSGLENNFPFANLGTVNNRGWEFTAEYKNRINDLNYGISFNITHVKNKVKDFGADVKPIVEGQFSDIWTIEGSSIRSYYGYEVDGIYNSADSTSSPYLAGIRPGDFKFKDQDGNDTIDARDRKVIGNSIPAFFYGANLALSWKGIDFSLMLQGEFDKELLVTPEFAMDFGNLYDHANMYKEVYDKRWKQEGDNSYYPALGAGSRGINNVANTRWVQNASYMRIKSIQIGYTLPKSVTSRLKINSLRIFATGSNLFTFTKYPGFDPEMERNFTRGGTDYPQAKTVTGGVSITF